jgi:hypothetical protein
MAKSTLAVHLASAHPQIISWREWVFNSETSNFLQDQVEDPGL